MNATDGAVATHNVTWDVPTEPLTIISPLAAAGTLRV